MSFLKNLTYSSLPYLSQGLLLGAAIWIGLGLIVWLISGVDHSVWLLDMRWAPKLIRLIILTILFLGLLILGCGHHAKNQKVLPRFLRITLRIVMWLAFGLAIFNAANYWRLLLIGQLFRGSYIPFSIGVSFIGLLGVHQLRQITPRKHKKTKSTIKSTDESNLKQATNTPTKPTQTAPKTWQAWQTWSIRLTATFALLLTGPYFLMLTYGKSDYRNQSQKHQTAQSVVVFGARVYADGRMSKALHDRIHTACLLIQNGYANTLIVSGGPGDGDQHEAHAMRDYAITMGISEQKIHVDLTGLNTAATVNHTFEYISPGDQIIAVSHGYHLPRIKLCYAQAGIDARTVPADPANNQTLTAMPWYMTREVAAWWKYYFEPLFTPHFETFPSPQVTQQSKPDSSTNHPRSQKIPGNRANR